jgi:hypothetical protein
MTCPASQAPGERVDTADESALNGTAVHHLMAVGIGCGEWLPPREVARAFGADPDEVEKLIGAARYLWADLAKYFPSPKTEQPLTWDDKERGIVLTGTADVLSLDNGRLRVGDWKSGWEEGDHEAQLRGYGLLALKTHPEADEVWSALISVRHRFYDGRVWTREELDDWYAHAGRRLLRTDTYSPGRWCRHCPRKFHCTVRPAMVRQAVLTLCTYEPADLEGNTIDGEIVGQVYDAAKTFEDALHHAKEAVRFTVAQAGGKLAIGSGRQLELTETHPREIDPKIALPVLQQHFGERVAECVKIPVGKIETLAASNAGRGQKKSAIHAVMDRLEREGAVVRRTQERLECRRIGEQSNVIANAKPAIENHA